jgi:hypothetical protein
LGNVPLGTLTNVPVVAFLSSSSIYILLSASCLSQMVGQFRKRVIYQKVDKEGRDFLVVNVSNIVGSFFYDLEYTQQEATF